MVDVKRALDARYTVCESDFSKTPTMTKDQIEGAIAFLLMCFTAIEVPAVAMLCGAPGWLVGASACLGLARATVDLHWASECDDGDEES